MIAILFHPEYYLYPEIRDRTLKQSKMFTDLSWTYTEDRNVLHDLIHISSSVVFVASGGLLSEEQSRAFNIAYTRMIPTYYIDFKNDHQTYLLSYYALDSVDCFDDSQYIIIKPEHERDTISADLILEKAENIDNEFFCSHLLVKDTPPVQRTVKIANVPIRSFVSFSVTTSKIGKPKRLWKCWGYVIGKSDSALKIITLNLLNDVWIPGMVVDVVQHMLLSVSQLELPTL